MAHAHCEPSIPTGGPACTEQLCCQRPLPSAYAQLLCVRLRCSIEVPCCALQPRWTLEILLALNMGHALQPLVRQELPLLAPPFTSLSMLLQIPSSPYTKSAAASSWWGRIRVSAAPNMCMLLQPLLRHQLRLSAPPRLARGPDACARHIIWSSNFAFSHV